MVFISLMRISPAELSFKKFSCSSEVQFLFTFSFLSVSWCPLSIF